VYKDSPVDLKMWNQASANERSEAVSRQCGRGLTHITRVGQLYITKLNILTQE